jgi:uncharacterized protein YbjT (DUF2867 family)
MANILVTGPTGNVGLPLVQELLEVGVAPKLAVRKVDHEDRRLKGYGEQVPFDFEDPATFEQALEHVDRVFLLRPPHISDEKVFLPFIEAMKAANVRQVVFLSLQGAEQVPVMPHRRIEKLLLQSDLPWTFLRPSFFMQNLSNAHRREIAGRGELLVPAGNGATSFIDARDIAAVATQTLIERGHTHQAYELTGSVALTYNDVAAIMSEVLERAIRYRDASLPRFWAWRRKLGDSWNYILVTTALYTACRFGLASKTTMTLERLLDRPPRTLGQFVRDYAQAWQKPAPLNGSQGRKADTPGAAPQRRSIPVN